MMNISQLLRDLAVPTHGLYGAPRDQAHINQQAGAMTDVDAMQELVMRQVEPSTVEAITALLGDAATYQPPTEADIDALMHAARQRALADQVPLSQNVAPGTFVPELSRQAPVTPAPKDAATARIEALQAEHGAAGFTFEYDSRGQMVISNTEATRAAALQGAKGYLAESPTAVTAPAEIASRLRTLSEIQDPTQRDIAFAQIQAEAAAYKSSILQELTQQGEARLGIPELEATLAENEALDRSDPRWHEFQSDSPVTARVRVQLAQARSSLTGELSRMAASNVKLASLDSMMQAAGQTYQRAESRGARREDWEWQQQERRNLALQEALDTMRPENMARAIIAFPDMAGKDPTHIAQYLIKHAPKDAQEAIMAAGEALPAMALLGNNIYAQQILAATEAQRTGKPEAQVKAELAQIQSDMTAPIAQLRPMLRELGIQNEELQGLETMHSPSRSLIATKDQREQMQAQRYELAMRMASKRAEQQLLGNVDQWGIVNNPALDAAVQAAKTADGSTDAATVLKLFTAGISGQERTVRQEEFFQLMESAAARYRNSLYAAPSAGALRTYVIAEANRKSLWERLQETTPLDVVAGTGQLFPTPWSKQNASLVQRFLGDSQ